MARQAPPWPCTAHSLEQKLENRSNCSNCSKHFFSFSVLSRRLFICFVCKKNQIPFFLTPILTHVSFLHLTLKIDVGLWWLFSLYFFSKDDSFKTFWLQVFLILVTGLLLHFLSMPASDLPHPYRNQVLEPEWRMLYSVLDDKEGV